MNVSTSVSPPSGPLANKVALVLGASRGIGAATARALARAGASVVLASRDASALEAAAAHLRWEGAQAIAVPTDALDDQQLARAVHMAVETFGGLDIAFNNAGSGHMPAPLAELTTKDIDDAIGINLRGILVAMKFELAAMLARGGGAIVNMSSTAGVQGVRGMAAYSATKHAVVGATRSAALDYAAKGIRVNVVAPGPILTDRLKALPEERRAPIERAVPMGRVGAEEEVASTVVWLASDAASFVTGAVIPIDGGRTAGA
ncbi:3-oxoacyl-[acyl-carrier protein] reductase [Labilithrix luteola]|uniref:3-oxoacyl-[acyl-carrier protein] reductase n=1 Tax=Labilithrix luteola TaxID=1391654 RepID=A0A0K1PLY8_9BACT|nr:glucose 1-dehydrogenase [Labilithrix luteola]AKU94537.1 3-oxoacyl-[acyl-carrier protein] reductase [Labilithrix luteola]